MARWALKLSYWCGAIGSADWRVAHPWCNTWGVCEQTTVPGCAQTTLAALAKRQFGRLKRHLCHTLELGFTPVTPPGFSELSLPGRIVWPQVCQICTSQNEKFSRYTLILYFSPIQYWRNCRKICQTVSDRPKIMEKFSQLADENGHVLLPGRYLYQITEWDNFNLHHFLSFSKITLKHIVKS